MWLLSINSVGSTWSGLRQFVNRAREGGERGESSGGQTQHQSDSFKEQRDRKRPRKQSQTEKEMLQETNRDATSLVQFQKEPKKST